MANTNSNTNTNQYITQSDLSTHLLPAHTLTKTHTQNTHPSRNHAMHPYVKEKRNHPAPLPSPPRSMKETLLDGCIWMDNFMRPRSRENRFGRTQMKEARKK
mmetsp:Transcript_3836/g.8767  ORF Transcript_3836/g.8767 Transcript_3836/m.8767 type:complete len:102 (-) Transcript_3836:197-502(-)